VVAAHTRLAAGTATEADGPYSLRRRARVGLLGVRDARVRRCARGARCPRSRCAAAAAGARLAAIQRATHDADPPTHTPVRAHTHTHTHTHAKGW